MDLQLQNKVAIVTGASKGIGLAVVTALAQEGVRVVAASRGQGAELSELAERYAVQPVAVDLSTADGPAKLVESAIAKFGRVDILINNVGGTHMQAGFLSISDEDWYRTFDMDVMSTVRASRAVLPHMLEHRSGVIINISSVNAHLPVTQIMDYCAIKAALTNLSKALAEEFGPQGVRVNTVSPGTVLTPQWDAEGGNADLIGTALGMDRETVLSQLPKMNNMTINRLIQPAEVAAIVAFLASEHAAAIVGADYIVDGGTLKAVI
ncbi:SDR family oxidoreductase [Ktedonosporobacter rubrisoli]|uniref:SDR family oxidoreductase n=1 Tax=Ktedonosporobacter rubrisoli TaxID=2509675 RepID=A0A4P6K0G1_KTERU|nr:oxidoreductase [Ktedonosporobacter rubrisoli]QBD81110.1 SDR family oxidoreductase [Ktedonosporobacter rubrisoli]